MPPETRARALLRVPMVGGLRGGVSGRVRTRHACSEVARRAAAGRGDDPGTRGFGKDVEDLMRGHFLALAFKRDEGKSASAHLVTLWPALNPGRGEAGDRGSDQPSLDRCWRSRWYGERSLALLRPWSFTMQKVAAYILERTEDLQQSDARKAEGARLRSVVEAWLTRKGGSPSANSTGTYAAVDGSDASYLKTEVIDCERSWQIVELTEVTPEGRKFVTSVSVTVGNKNVVVYVTMEVGSVASSITRIKADVRCPNVVRELLALPGNWYHGASRLRTLSKVDGFDAGEALAIELQNKDRTIPFVVVSCIDGQPALPKLDERLANDLAGVANVYSIDEEASWALTDILRKPLSTYSGAVRIYWPQFANGDDPFRHALWTATRLQGIEADPKKSLERIRRQLRTVIMRASAVSVVRPGEIDDIRGSAARAEYAVLQAKAAALEELKAKAKSLEDFKEIADSYAADNDQLRRDLASRDNALDELRDELRKAEADKQALLFQLGQAKAPADEVADVEPDAPEQDESDQPPRPGEVRFYKKTHSRPGYDVLVARGDCGHTSWQATNKAEKALKGLERLLGEHSNWKKVEHCGRCGGGGVYRVEW